MSGGETALAVEAHPNDDAPRDATGRPYIVPKAGGKPRTVRRTTTFIKALGDTSGLERWQRRMILAGAALRPALMREIAGLDPERDRSRFDGVVEELKRTAGAESKADLGTAMHLLTEHMDAGLPLPPFVGHGGKRTPVTTEMAADVFAYAAETDRFDVVMMERFAYCSGTDTAGTLDRVWAYKGELPDRTPFDGNLIGDIKTGRVDGMGGKFAMHPKSRSV
jgi:hypothetical protein